MLISYDVPAVTKTRMWCLWCRALRLMDPMGKLIWGDWRCRVCKRERPLRLLPWR